jgi:hypothetical protein
MFAKTIAAGLIAATALTAVPARADNFSIQFGFGAPGYGTNHGHWDRGHHDRDRRNGVSPREVRWILQGRGYHHIRFVDRRGPIYQVRASKNGRDFFLVVSARNGDIVSRNRV